MDEFFISLLREFGPYAALAIYLLWDRRQFEDRVNKNNEKREELTRLDTEKREERLYNVIEKLDEYKTETLEDLVRDTHAAIDRSNYITGELIEIRAKRRESVPT